MPPKPKREIPESVIRNRTRAKLQSIVSDHRPGQLDYTLARLRKQLGKFADQGGTDEEIPVEVARFLERVNAGLVDATPDEGPGLRNPLPESIQAEREAMAPEDRPELDETGAAKG